VAIDPGVALENPSVHQQQLRNAVAAAHQVVAHRFACAREMTAGRETSDGTETVVGWPAIASRATTSIATAAARRPPSHSPGPRDGTDRPAAVISRPRTPRP
jgi:hypothetical protein